MKTFLNHLTQFALLKYIRFSDNEFSKKYAHQIHLLLFRCRTDLKNFQLIHQNFRIGL